MSNLSGAPPHAPSFFSSSFPPLSELYLRLAPPSSRHTAVLPPVVRRAARRAGGKLRAREPAGEGREGGQTMLIGKARKKAADRRATFDRLFVFCCSFLKPLKTDRFETNRRCDLPELRPRGVRWVNGGGEAATDTQSLAVIHKKRQVSEIFKLKWRIHTQENGFSLRIRVCNKYLETPPLAPIGSRRDTRHFCFEYDPLKREAGQQLECVSASRLCRQRFSLLLL